MKESLQDKAERARIEREKKEQERRRLIQKEEEAKKIAKFQDMIMQ